MNARLVIGFSLAAFVAACVVGSPASAALIDNTTLNGSFESLSGGASGKVMFITGNVTDWTNWAEQETANNDTGTDGASGGTHNGLDGSRVAFLQPGGAILNMTSHVIEEGDIIGYSFWNSLEGRAPATISLVWDNTGAMDKITGTDVAADAGTQGVGQYTVLAGDAWIGSTLGVGMVSGGNWPEVDQVYLAIVPEPSTFALTGLVWLLGAIGACVIRKRRG